MLPLPAEGVDFEAQDTLESKLYLGIKYVFTA